jgi:hypothetical protein
MPKHEVDRVKAMNHAEGWYVVLQLDGHCEIVATPPIADPDADTPSATVVKQWGPFASPAEALARRVGLIRAGKCQPI